ncbi:ATP-binding cassette domain-containing protein, partial [Methanobrevibacter gottschalkii]|uniref:energy-coupling factor ABC transporter ATP-binding protein n=2 Tax=Methanobacteriaceae TaxID=2159 RepID=UPI0026F10C54
MQQIHLETKNLSFTYPDGTEALKNVNIQIKKGEKIAIMGPNGAGKSTLFSHFNGLSEPTSGHVEIDGEKIVFTREELLKVRQKVGIVFQDPNDQLFAPTVKEDVAFGPMNLGLDYDEVNARIKEALEMVGMSGFEDKTPHHLSGGQQKRVAIAGIIAM